MRRRPALDIEVHAIKDDISEWARGALAAQEEVPHLRREGLRLRVRGEADLARRAAQTERDQLSLGLARLDIFRHCRRAVRECCAREHGVVPLVASLLLVEDDQHSAK